MSFAATGVTATGGIRVSPIQMQAAPTGSVSASYDASTGTVRVSNTIKDLNGITLSPNSAGRLNTIHYFVETALFNPFNRAQISGWRPLGRIEEGSSSLPLAWAGQTIRVNAVFKDGLGKTETVFGSSIKLPVGQAASSPTSGVILSNSPLGQQPSVSSEAVSAPTQISDSQSLKSSFSVQKIGDASEGEAAVFRVTRSGNTSIVGNIQVETFNGSARIGQDFVGKSEFLWFAPGETTRDVHISTLQDQILESAETLSLQLRSFGGSSIVSSQGVATASIIDRGLTPPAFRTIASTAAQDILIGTLGADHFQMYATPSTVATTFRADRITNFAPEEGDFLTISRSAYRLKSSASSVVSVSHSTDLKSAYAAGYDLVHERYTGLLFVNPSSTIEGSGGPIIQFDNKPVFVSLSDSIKFI